MSKCVVIDTDPGVDDALALLLSLRSSELQVEAITTVSGNVSLEQATRNVCLLLNLVQPTHRPVVAMGAAHPLRKKPVTAQSIHGSDGLGELHRFTNPDGAPKYPYPALPRHLPGATEVLLDLLERHPDELTLIALGPLTNLAKALLADTQRVKRLREVIIMGGAIQVPGNITPAAEFNMFVDPDAAHHVFRSGLPITLVPLDVTEKVVLESKDIEKLCQTIDEPLSTFVCDATSKAMEYMKRVRGMAVLALHDPLAVGVAIDPTMIETTLLHVDVEIHGTITKGMTVPDLRPIRADLREPSNVHVALKVNATRFLTFFQERLCPRLS